MKKQAMIGITGVLMALLLLFTGCGSGEGAEDTGEDGKITKGTRTTTSQTADTTTGMTTGSATGDHTGATGATGSGTTAASGAAGVTDNSMTP